MQQLKIVLLSTILCSPSVIAGWNSGGGELLSDAANPWFLENTKEVSYCIKIDEANFGILRSIASQKITKVIDYWKFQFSYGEPAKDLMDDILPKLGTQKFVETDCTEDTDIVFQFGVLSKKQHDHLGNPRKVVGIAVRTEYDQSNLRGKGFIYISPQFGSLSLDRPNSLKDRWAIQDSALLELILAHEMGHVFGARHFDHIVMSETTPDQITDVLRGKRIAEMIERGSLPNAFPAPRKNFVAQTCWSGQWDDPVMGMPKNWRCLKIVVKALNGETGTPIVVAYAKKSKSAKQWVKIGESTHGYAGFGSIMRNDHAFAPVFLPEAQKVFSTKARFLKTFRIYKPEVAFSYRQLLTNKITTLEFQVGYSLIVRGVIEGYKIYPAYNLPWEILRE